MLSSSRAKYASLLILLASATPSFAAPIAVALTGTTAPGGGTFSAFTNPVLSASGQVAFNASVAGGTSTSGIFTGTPGSLTAVALQGTAAPGTGGEIFGNLYTSATAATVTLNNGLLGFNASLSGGTPTSGVFIGTSSATLAPIALQGTAAPAGGNYNVFLAPNTNSPTSPLINSSGTVAFQSSLTGGTPSPGAGVFLGTNSANLQAVALLGQNAPTPATGTYAAALTVPLLNGNGQVAFISVPSSKQGIFAGSPGSIQTVMLQGTVAPGTGGALYGTPTSSAYSYNNAGQVAFTSSLTGGTPTNGIFLGAPGSVLPVALQGTVAPGTGGETYGGLGSAAENGAGQAVFTASALSGGTITSGLFLGAPGAVKPVALASTTGVGGSLAPDGSGATFASFGSTELPNANGQVVFIGNLIGTGVTTGTNSVGLFGGTPGFLAELARTGDTIDLNPDPLVDDIRTISGFGLLANVGGQDGKGFDFNDNGVVVYRMTFTDGSSGIFESTVPVPEPTSLGLLAAGAGMLLGRNRKRSGK